MEMNSCCFTGHRHIPAEERERLSRRVRDGIDYLYALGVTAYYAGGALGFDALAAEAVIKRRQERWDLRLNLILPCRNQAECWSEEEKARYERIKGEADDVLILSESYYQGCMHQRNRALVDRSAFCICYLRTQTGGTAYTVRYAREKGLKIWNLARPKCVSPQKTV